MSVRLRLLFSRREVTTLDALALRVGRGDGSHGTHRAVGVLWPLPLWGKRRLSGVETISGDSGLSRSLPGLGA